MTPVEFRGDLWHQKTRLPGLSCGVVCVILRLAVLVELRLVTDGQTDGRTDGHRAMASRPTADAEKTERWGAGMVICLERGADLHMAQLIPLPLTVSCFSKIQIGFTFLVPAHPGSPGQRAVKRVWSRCGLTTLID